jgi:hypothetical protein
MVPRFVDDAALNVVRSLPKDGPGPSTEVIQVFSLANGCQLRMTCAMLGIIGSLRYMYPLHLYGAPSQSVQKHGG